MPAAKIRRPGSPSQKWVQRASKHTTRTHPVRALVTRHQYFNFFGVNVNGSALFP